ncbi:GAF domain-containing protein [Streptomyces bambusae]|uniref:GAF domain-containing protein n=1 Tax=Streptomyces bambusae TaxID=1550616 RepID=UPI001CFE1AF5|nr:GAF domain-containing protein [Streptomyces bambusae]MCB5168388.1 GAF domain-containing protein [Streptomyces bambusae]
MTAEGGAQAVGGDPWVALPAGADAAEREVQLRRAHRTFADEGRVEGAVREVVAASWRRCARALVSPECSARVDVSDGDLRSYREKHPLAAVMPLFRELVGAFAAGGEHLLAVCDARGRLLWVEGHAQTRRRADGLGFVPGARWAESVMGTNAPGTAVAEDRPVQVFGAEHFSRGVHPWTCAAAPVHDPRTGRLLGAVDVTGGPGLAHPHSLAFVRAVARAAESQLALREPAPPAARDGLFALGRDEAVFAAGGRRIRLGRRHSEILVLLSRHPGGLSGEELLIGLYEDESVSPVTLRAELSRLRALLGPDVLRSRPYRLAAPVETDFGAAARQVAVGAVSAALAGYPGPLLPSSAAPEIVRLRERLADQLRAALIARGDPGLLADWAYAPWGEDDLAVWQALAAALPGDRGAAALARARRLDAELRG